MGLKVWFDKHRTMVGAMVATVFLGAMVVDRRMEPHWVVVPLTIAWMLALHSADNRRMSERYERVISTAMEGLALAGVNLSRGRRASAAADIANAVEGIAAQILEQDRSAAQVEEKAAG